MRNKMYSIVIPEEQLYFVNIIGVLESKKNIIEYLVVIHEKPTVAPHYHIFMEFDEPIERKTLECWFKGCEVLFNVIYDKRCCISYMLDSNLQHVRVIGKKNAKETL